METNKKGVHRSREGSKHTANNKRDAFGNSLASCKNTQMHSILDASPSTATYMCTRDTCLANTSHYVVENRSRLEHVGFLLFRFAVSSSTARPVSRSTPSKQTTHMRVSISHPRTRTCRRRRYEGASVPTGLPGLLLLLLLLLPVPVISTDAQQVVHLHLPYRTAPRRQQIRRVSGQFQRLIRVYHHSLACVHRAT